MSFCYQLRKWRWGATRQHTNNPYTFEPLKSRVALRLPDLQIHTSPQTEPPCPVFSPPRLFAVAALEVLHKVGEFLNGRYAQGVID